MTKADIIEAVYEKVGGFSKKEAAEIVESVFKQIKDTLKDGEKITLGPSGLSLDTRGLTSSASGVSIGASRISFTSSGLSLASWQSLVKAPSGVGTSSSPEPSQAPVAAAAKLTQSRPGRGRSTATKADSKRQIIQQSPMLIISREANLDAHNDPSRRGGYLLLAPGQVPEIVLDGLSSDAEQFDAERLNRLVK